MKKSFVDNYYLNIFYSHLVYYFYYIFIHFEIIFPRLCPFGSRNRSVTWGQTASIIFLQTKVWYPQFHWIRNLSHCNGAWRIKLTYGLSMVNDTGGCQYVTQGQVALLGVYFEQLYQRCSKLTLRCVLPVRGGPVPSSYCFATWVCFIVIYDQLYTIDCVNWQAI